MSGGDDSGEGLTLHGGGAGAFRPEEGGGVLNKGRNPGTDGRIIEISRDAEAGEETCCEFAVGVIDAGGHEGVIASPEQGEIDKGDGGLTSGREKGAVARLEFADTSGELEDSGGAVET